MGSLDAYRVKESGLGFGCGCGVRVVSVGRPGVAVGRNTVYFYSDTAASV